MTKSQNRKNGSRKLSVKHVGKFSVSDDTLLRQRTAEKAYELYECRGCGSGRDVDDWLEAERLVLAEIELHKRPKHARQNRSPVGAKLL